jgi:phosphoglycerate kinase
MSVTAPQMQAWCESLIEDSLDGKSLQDYLAAIPRLDSLADVPSGTPVLVRGDVDAKPGNAIGEGDIRLRSMLETLQFGQERGWKQIVFGHIGRKPEGSLAKVAKRLGELLGREVPLLDNWLDESTLTISDNVAVHINESAPGSVLMLENTRKYSIETCLWNATVEDLPDLAPKLAKLVNEYAEKIATVYVNEALSAGSLDVSSVVVPAAMERVALGKYVASEFDGPMQRCLQTRLVVFSGLKIDKLDDLEAMINRDTIRTVFAAGSLAMALKKAIGELDGKSACLGVAEDSAHSDQPYYIPRERVEQAKRMIREGREKGIEFVVPIDSVISDGSVKDELSSSDQQFDVGPKTRELFSKKVGEFLTGDTKDAVVFHNGVFGMFEDPKFEEGTRAFMSELKRMKDAGVEVYIGGGEGGTALEKYGQSDWVTHVFTAGGTVLNALGSKPVPYLEALEMAAQKKGVS